MSEIKGATKPVPHRAFTYQEKKFNQLGKSGLIDYFKPKISPEKVQDMMMDKHNQDITIVMAKRVARTAAKEIWEKDVEKREFALYMIDTILIFSDKYDITNTEAFAMTLHVYKALQHIKEEDITAKDVNTTLDKVLPEINKLRLQNWDRFMRILKEVT